MQANEVTNPVAVGFLGTRAVALHPHGGLHPVHQLRWLCCANPYEAWDLKLFFGPGKVGNAAETTCRRLANAVVINGMYRELRQHLNLNEYTSIALIAYIHVSLVD